MPSSFPGLADIAIHPPARLRLRAAAVDVQAVRHQRRRLHQPGRALGDRGRRPRADGAAGAPGRGRPESQGTNRQSLPKTGPKPRRCHHHRGIHGIVPKRRCYH